MSSGRTSATRSSPGVRQGRVGGFRRPFVVLDPFDPDRCHAAGGTGHRVAEGHLADQLLDEDWSELATPLSSLGHPIRISSCSASPKGGGSGGRTGPDRRSGHHGSDLPSPTAAGGGRMAADHHQRPAPEPSRAPRSPFDDPGRQPLTSVPGHTECGPSRPKPFSPGAEHLGDVPMTPRVPIGANAQQAVVLV